MSRSGAIAPVVGALLAISLAGCTPKPVAQAAVRFSGNGTAEVVLALCPGDSPSRVSLYDVNDGALTWEAVAPREVDESAAAPRQDDEVASFALFSTPPGWTAGGTLEALAPGRQYALSVIATKSHTSVSAITVEELDRLADGEVWTMDGYRARAMTETAFRQAADRCG